MKIENYLLIVILIATSTSCEDELLLNNQFNGIDELDPLQIPKSITIDDFDEDSILINQTILTFQDGLLFRKTYENFIPDSLSQTFTTEYIYEDKLLIEERNYYNDPSLPWITRYSYNEDGKILQIYWPNHPDSSKGASRFDYESPYSIKGGWRNLIINLVEQSDFEIDQIISLNDSSNSITSDFFYTEGLLSSIAYTYEIGSGIEVEEFEYLDKKVKGGYNKLKFKYGSQWKANALLVEGYSHNLEEAYITRHKTTASGKIISEWQFWYEFDSLDRISKQYLTFTSRNKKFSCNTYYTY